MSDTEQEPNEVNGQIVDAVETSTGAVMGSFKTYPDQTVSPAPDFSVSRSSISSR